MNTKDLPNKLFKPRNLILFMKMSILISILLLSCVVVGAEIDYGTIDHTQQGSRFDITGSVVSDKPVDFISIELVMRALEEGASRGLPDITIESDFNNYKMDAGAISDVGLVMVDVLMNPATGRPEEDAMLQTIIDRHLFQL